MNNETYLENVRNQYEDYPYPFRDPSDENHRLIEIGIERLELINFYCFKGRCDFSNFRVLVAGGGTGDSTIFLAEQLKDCNAEIYYVDISDASMKIAQKRAKQRNLHNITWVHGSLLSLNPNLGKFDYISCTGVLHHLDDPELGLDKLSGYLNDKGALGLMLYGQYGRTGVYQMQELMKLINVNESSLSNKIENTKNVLDNLPNTNWFCHNQNLLVDHKKSTDNGLVDLLLHEQDRAYTIAEVYLLLDSVRLNFIAFSDVKMRMSYRPEQYISNPELLAKIKQLPEKEQHAIAELIVGAFKKHEFYVSKTEDTKAKFSELSNIPFFFPVQQYANLGVDLANAMLVNSNQKISMKHSSGFEFDIIASQLNYAFFKHIDGINSLADIFDCVRAELNDHSINDSQLLSYFQPVYLQFQQLDWLLLKAK